MELLQIDSLPDKKHCSIQVSDTEFMIKGNFYYLINKEFRPVKNGNDKCSIKEYMGLGSLFTSILQVLNLAELGFSSAITFSMYKPIAQGDEETVCALMAYYKKIYRMVGTTIGTAGIVLLPFIRLLIYGTWPEDVNIYLLYVIYLFNTVSSYFLYASS